MNMVHCKMSMHSLLLCTLDFHTGFVEVETPTLFKRTSEVSLVRLLSKRI